MRQDLHPLDRSSFEVTHKQPAEICKPIVLFRSCKSRVLRSKGYNGSQS